MSEDEQESTNEHQNAVSKMRYFGSAKWHLLQTPDASPEAWGEVCVEVLQEYQRIKMASSKNGKYGSTRLRADIMRSHDIYAGDKLVGLDTRLSEQNVTSWLKGSIPKDDKLFFLNAFVERLLVEGEIDVFSQVKKKADLAEMRALAKLYARRDNRSSDAEHVFQTVPHILQSEIITGSLIKRIFVKIQHTDEATIRVLLCYASIDTAQLDEAKSDHLLFFEGILIPQPQFTTDDVDLISQYFPVRESRMLEPWYCQLKLFRPQARGDHFFGHADGIVYFGYDRQKHSKSPKEISLLLPHSATNPIPDINEDTRYLGNFLDLPKDLPLFETSEKKKLQKCSILIIRDTCFND